MRSRHTCPQCKKPKKYIRYLDNKTGKYLPYDYGKCERLNNCGYHLNPYTDGYAKEVWKKENGKDWRKTKTRKWAKPPATPKAEQHYIPFEIFKSSLRSYENNRFYQYLVKLFGPEKSADLMQRFYIGTSKYWPGSTVFWLLDGDRKVAGGQIVLFDASGHTHRMTKPDGSEQRFNGWVHTAIKANCEKSGQPMPAWLKSYIEHSPKFPCLFGLSQLTETITTQPIAIVEAAKTAVIASGYLPEFVWMAVGSLSYLNEKRLSPLRDRNIILFPDQGGYQRWKQKAAELSSLAKITVSDLLENNKVEPGSDLADYLVLYAPKEFLAEQEETQQVATVKAKYRTETWTRYDGVQVTNIINEHGYPALWDEP